MNCFDYIKCIWSKLLNVVFMECDRSSHRSFIDFLLLYSILHKQKCRLNAASFSSNSQNEIFVTVKRVNEGARASENIHWEHKNPHKNTIKIIIKPTYLLLVYIHKYLLLFSFSLAQSHSIARAFIQQPQPAPIQSLLVYTHEYICVVPHIFNAIIISFVRNLNRPHEPYKYTCTHARGQNALCVFCVYLSFAVTSVEPRMVGRLFIILILLLF